METILDIRKKTEMTREQFAEYFGIPVSTLKNWERGTREIPSYLCRLIAYKAEMEKLYKKT